MGDVVKWWLRIEKLEDLKVKEQVKGLIKEVCKSLCKMVASLGRVQQLSEGALRKT